jgi:hypothetical protein
MTERNRLVNTYFPNRTRYLVEQLREAELYPEVRTPEFSQHGGHVEPGAKITLAAGTIFRPQPGQIYYTIDGSDPRVRWTGEVSPAALLYDRLGSGFTVQGSVEVKVRLLDGENWSALNAAQFSSGKTPAPGSLVVSEIHYRPGDASVEEAAQGFAAEDFEFLELLNVGNEALDLTSLVLEEGVDFRFTEAAIRHLEPGARLVLAQDLTAFEARYGTGLPVAGEFSRNLGNDGDRLLLSGVEGEVLIDLTYGDGPEWPAQVAERHSLVPADPRAAGDPSDPGYWVASANPGGSPGVADPAETGSALPDTDGDGLPDWAEDALGADPDNPGSGPDVLRFSVVGDGGIHGGTAYAHLEVPVNPAVTGVQILPEASRDLEHWDAGFFRIVSGGGSEEGPRVYESVLPLTPGEAQLFVRLRIQRSGLPAPQP